MPSTDSLAHLRERGLVRRDRPLRLHLGCGEQRLDGYVNVDLPPEAHNIMRSLPDLECDLAGLAFPDGSVDEIRLHHVFEHFGRVAALALLIRWHGWLKSGGLLRIETPDLAGSARVITSDAPIWHKTAAARHLSGDQAAPWAFHVDLWFPERFERTLRHLGFDVRTETRTWPDPPHLANVEVWATKRFALSRAELLVAADELLWDSTVARVERPVWELWRAQLRAILDGAPPLRPAPASVPTAARDPRGAPSVVGVVFSKDRPLQLEATLRSFLTHCRDREHVDLKVLYLATSDTQRLLYRQLADEYPSITFLEERAFREDLLAALGTAQYWLFLVDDNLFVADFTIADALAALQARTDALGFSLRLGRNTVYVYTLDQPQPLPTFDEVAPDVLEYDWKTATLAFAYPLEVSSSIYRAADIAPILAQLAFINPNTLEAELARVATPSSELKPRLLCFERSVVFSVPINVVQQVFANRAGMRPEYSSDALAEAFAAGDRIDTAAFAGLVPGACHQEVEIAWRRGERPVASTAASVSDAPQTPTDPAAPPPPVTPPAPSGPAARLTLTVIARLRLGALVGRVREVQLIDDVGRRSAGLFWRVLGICGGARSRLRSADVASARRPPPH